MVFITYGWLLKTIKECPLSRFLSRNGAQTFAKGVFIVKFGWKMKEAYRMLDLEITQKGGIKIHDLITSEYVEDQLKMYALQSLSNAPRTGTYDLEFLHSLENMYLKAGLDYSETDHTIDKKGLEALKECYKNIKFKKSGDWLERGGGDIIAGVTLIAGGMVMSQAGNRSLKIRSERIGSAGSGKTYSVKRGPKLQGKGVSGKKASEASGTGNGANSPKNVGLYEKYKDVLRTTEKAKPLVDSLKETGKLPDNFISKEAAELAGWKPGKAIENYAPGSQLGGDVFKNNPPILPESPGRIWYEADVGLSGSMSRAKQPGTRLVYSNDGLMYVTTDHYETVHLIGNYLK
jgi:hypothetical protein